MSLKSQMDDRLSPKMQEQWSARARNGCFDYRTVYGQFPHKVGVVRGFPLLYDKLIITAFKPIPILRLDIDYDYSTLPDPIERICIPIEIVNKGPDIRENEVYFPQFGQEVEVISAADLSLLVVDGTSRNRYQRPAMTDTERYVRRMERLLLAEQKSELDVCSSCYRRYTPLRQLLTIYPEWPPSWVPVCDYCEEQAKYHVKRSLWIEFPTLHTPFPTSPTTQKDDVL